MIYFHCIVVSIVSCHLNVGGSIGISAVMLVLSNGIIHQLDIQYRTIRAEGRGGDLARGETLQLATSRTHAIFLRQLQVENL